MNDEACEVPLKTTERADYLQGWTEMERATTSLKGALGSGRALRAETTARNAHFEEQHERQEQ
jgi:hypothetical protein